MTPGSYENYDFDPNDFGADNEFIPPKTEKKKSEFFPPPFSLAGADLSRPPGFVGEVTDWLDGQCRYPRRKLCVASALVTVGNIGGLRHQDDVDGVTANLLAFCVAASSTGKEAVQQAMAQLHAVVGVQRAIWGGIKSEQETVRNMIQHQPAYYVIDEVGIFFQKVRNAQNRGGAAYLEGVFGVVMSAYSKANSRYLLNGDTKRELEKQYVAILARAEENDDERRADAARRMLEMIENGLERPFLSMVGYTTPSTFDGILDGETATQGFLGRAIIINEHDLNPRGREDFRKEPINDILSRKLTALWQGGAYDMMSGQRIEHVGEYTQITTTPEARLMLKQVGNWLHDYANEMGEHAGEAAIAMVRRSYETIAKISFILGMQSGTRTAEHVRWSFAYVRQEIDAKIKLVFANDNSKERPEQAMAARIMGYLDTEKGTTLKSLAGRMRSKQEPIEAVLRKMQQSGMVREQTGQRKVAGVIPTVWVIVE